MQRILGCVASALLGVALVAGVHAIYVHQQEVHKPHKQTRPFIRKDSRTPKYLQHLQECMASESLDESRPLQFRQNSEMGEMERRLAKCLAMQKPPRRVA